MVNLVNTLENAFDNLQESDDVVLLSCSPFDTMYAEEDISVTVRRTGDNLCVAVGTQGSSDVVYNGDASVGTGGIERAARAAAEAIDNIRQTA